VTEPIRTQVRRAIEQAWAAAIESGTLPALPEDVEAPVVEVERPAIPDFGDYSTNLAMKLARPYRRAPLEIARILTQEMSRASSADPATLLASVDAVAPGFINIRVSDGALRRTLDTILGRPSAWGQVDVDEPRRVNIEFVSANPTGPLHIGNARGAFVGDLLARVFEAAGHVVTREYYFNDFGAQVRNLGASVWALANERAVPEDGYHGGYVLELARDLPADVLAAASAPDDPASIIGTWASERVRAAIEASLAHLRARYHVWKTEGSLHSEGWVERAIDKLRAGGHVYEEDGATWFRSTDYGDDKDRVIRKSNGDYTYFASDLGYVEEKFSRGFDHLIYVWGADHHGTVARLRNAAEAMGHDRAHVQMLLMAWVRFIRDGQEISMSKRSGEFITLDELLGEVGVDAARWYFGSRAPTSGIDFDIELAKKESAENPVYYVQYAHARIASIVRKAADAGLQPADSTGGILAGVPEAALARAVVRLPEVVEDAAAAEETQGITSFAHDLATTFHAFYRDARVIDIDDPERSRHRLALVEATRITLANALGLLGISAPESM